MTAVERIARINARLEHDVRAGAALRQEVAALAPGSTERLIASAVLAVNGLQQHVLRLEREIATLKSETES